MKKIKFATQLIIYWMFPALSMIVASKMGLDMDLAFVIVFSIVFLTAVIYTIWSDLEG